MPVNTLNLLYVHGSFNVFIVALAAQRVKSKNSVTFLEKRVRHERRQLHSGPNTSRKEPTKAII